MFCICTSHAARLAALLFVASMFLSSRPASSGEPAGKSWHRDWTAAWKDSQARRRPIVLFITAEHCHYCDKMDRDTYRDERVRRELEDRFVIASLDSGQHPHVVRRLNVHSFPTTVIMSPDAQVIDSITGYLGPQQMQSRLKAAGAKLASR